MLLGEWTTAYNLGEIERFNLRGREFVELLEAVVRGDDRACRVRTCLNQKVGQHPRTSPCARALIHSPDAVIHSPAEMMAVWPTTVTKSR